MSRSYWFPVIAAIGWIVLAGWAESHGGGQGAYQQYVQAKDTNQDDPKGVAPPVQSVQTGDIASPCTDPKTEDERDLCQQWRMAEAAEQMIKVSWTQLALTVASLLGLVLTVYYSRVAASAAIKTVDAIHTIERAYVFVEVALLSMRKMGQTVNIEFTVTFKNAGKTPAVLKRVRTYAVALDEYPDELTKDLTNQDIPPGKVIKADGEIKVADQMNYDHVLWDNIMNSNTKFLVLGQIDYWDIQRVPQRTGFCWELVPRNDRAQFEIAPTEKLNYRT